MRTKMVAGNWKMNKTLQEGVALATELKEAVKNPSCAVVIGTPFIHLATVALSRWLLRTALTTRRVPTRVK